MTDEALSDEQEVLTMLGKKASRTATVTALVLSAAGVGVAGAQPATAATACNPTWEKVRSYPTGSPNVSMYTNDIYAVTVKNCGSGGELQVDIARGVDKCLGYMKSGLIKGTHITVTYQDGFPWSANPPEPRGVKAGC